MKIIDIIAILGALAWLPQIFAWIYHWLQKPKIQIFNEEEAEVGFIKFGNAFNIRISFLASLSSTYKCNFLGADNKQ